MKTKVSIVRCRRYDPEEVRYSVTRALDLLGGISLFVKKGEKVLIKPNLLSARPPEDNVNTHIEVIRAIARMIKECEAVPIVGDNPGGSVSAKEVYDKTGISTMAKEEGFQLAESKNVKMVKGFPISMYSFECDKIISLPKMKTHSLMCLTGAVKNMYGLVSGLNKTQYHKMFPKPEEFVNILIDVFEIMKPNFVLMDGIIAMDGEGPSAGTLKDVGLLIASRDSVAVDSVFSYLIGRSPFDILTTKEAYKRGLGEADMANIEIAGERTEECFIKDFKLPRSKLVLRLSGPVIKSLVNLVKFSPYIMERACKKCRICSDSCPVSAITINGEKSAVDSHKCIRCMCCHEVCPYKSVVLKRNVVARALGL